MPMHKGDMIEDMVLAGLVATMVTLELLGRRLAVRDGSIHRSASNGNKP